MEHIIIPLVMLGIFAGIALWARLPGKSDDVRDMSDNELSMESHFTGRWPNKYSREIERRASRK